MNINIKKLELELLDAKQAAKLEAEGRLGKDIYCLVLIRDSLSKEPYISTTLLTYNRGSWRAYDGRTPIDFVTHFAIVPIFPLRGDI